MRRYRLSTKREAVNLALREVATRPPTHEEQIVEWEAAFQEGRADVAAGRILTPDQARRELLAAFPELSAT